MNVKQLVNLVYKGDQQEAAKAAGISVGQLRNGVSREFEVLELAGGGYIVKRKNSTIFKKR